MSNEQLLANAVRHLVAIERDRELGYTRDELHMDPRYAIVKGLHALDAYGLDTDEIVYPEDQEALGLVGEEWRGDA